MKRRIEAAKKIFQLYAYTRKRPSQLEREKEDLYQELGGIKPVNIFGEKGSTNPETKELRKLAVCDQIEDVERYQQWFIFLNKIIVQTMLDSMSEEERTIIYETLIAKDKYKDVCKKHNISNPKILFEYINNTLEKALRKTYF
ncbi:MAG: hypothetical protein KBT03_04020 [Bacteroidales bacterium]|nr:hypothetical protein [Candidatus Scybalousia scybalohippi]